jgi:SAM-dependent methyltransferase
MIPKNPLARFSDRAQDYARYRPGYPEAAIDWMLASTASAEATDGRIQVADIGAGTGIASRLMADRGAQVIAIEPNQAMAEAAVPHAYVTGQTAQAEATNLPSQSADLVTCFQAFHWFQADQALLEFHRILRPSGVLALVWNDRDPSQGFTQALEALVQRVTQDNYLNSDNRRSVTAVETSSWFGPVQHHTYPYRQVLDYEGLIGRCRSSSYIPKTGQPYKELLTGLHQIFHQWKSPQGTVELLYQTHVYLTRSIH